LLLEGRPGTEAEAAYRRAAGAFISDSLFYLSWGLALEEIGNKKEAASAYERLPHPLQKQPY
jgi:hypothetical protein